jgi:hypothetical protein
MGFKKYIIPKGKHSIKGRLPSLFLGAKRLHYAVLFTESARYKTMLPGNQGDINKLIGFADGFAWGKREGVGNSKGWLNSARIGWRWVDAVGIVLLAYVYSNGRRIEEFLAYVDIGETFEIIIQKTAGVYQFFCWCKNAEEGYELVEIPRTTQTRNITGFKQLPYFGGDEFAPHDIEIAIKQL